MNFNHCRYTANLELVLLVGKAYQSTCPSFSSITFKPNLCFSNTIDFFLKKHRYQVNNLGSFPPPSSCYWLLDITIILIQWVNMWTKGLTTWFSMQNHDVLYYFILNDSISLWTLLWIWPFSNNIRRINLKCEQEPK